MMTARPTTKTWIRDRPLITSSQKDPRINPWVGCSTCTNKEPYKSTRNHEQSETSWYLLTQSKLCHILNQISQGLKMSLHFSCRQHNSMVSEVLHQFLKDMYVRMPHGTVIQSAKVSRRYGRPDGRFTVSHPWGNCFLASESDTDGEITTASPFCQLAGVAMRCLAANWRESRTRITSSKLRPVVPG